MQEAVYMAIDLKSFYASVECVDRKLNPLSTYLVVADKTRTEKTICLAVTPALKALGISGRPRLFEVVQQVAAINAARRKTIKGKKFTGKATDARILTENPDFALDYIVATPRMARYLEISSKIYGIYLQFVAAEDIHVYSIDEVFINLSPYRKIYNLSTRALAGLIVQEVLQHTGITATVGIGKNLYLAKIAMDIVAKHMQPDKDGVRIAELDEAGYRQLLWTHEPLQDFWRIGSGYTRKLAKFGLHTMGDVAKCSLGGKREYYNADLLYEAFGINAELLIDHAWGREPCTLQEIKAYLPKNHCLNTGQVLPRAYNYSEAVVIIREMAEALALDLLKQRLITDQLILTIGYDIENIKNEYLRSRYQGKLVQDHYQRWKPLNAHGSINLPWKTNSCVILTEYMIKLFANIATRDLLIRRVNITANHVQPELQQQVQYEEQDLFSTEEESRGRRILELFLAKEKALQEAVVEIKGAFGKNALLKGLSLLEGARTQVRNREIGGHKA